MITRLLLASSLLSFAMSFAGDSTVNAKPVSVPTLPNLETYAALWQQSLFKHSKDAPPPEPEPDVAPPEWAADLELSGWTEDDDKMVVYLIHKPDQIPIALSNDDSATSSDSDGGYRLIQIANKDSYTDMKVLVSLNGKSAWIKQTDEDASVDSGVRSPSQPVAPATVPVAPIAAVTSRLSLTKTPVILDNSSVIPVPSAQPSSAPVPSTPGTPTMPPTMPPTVPVVSPEQTAATLNLINSIRERSDWSVRNFPRQQ